jgi:putative SOS response-associated peptidase YedK
MCGRYVVTADPGQLALEFGADSILNAESFAPDYNVAPTKHVPAVLVRDGARLLTRLRWGLVPHWAKDPSVGARMINARVETVAEKPAFRTAFARRRCLLPADGYYEWLKPAEGTKGTKPSGPKQPYFIHRADGGTLAFAGVYERWSDPDGNELWTASILTGAAVAPLDRIHDRMPLTVPPGHRDGWLDPAVTDPATLRDLLDCAPDWVTHPVATSVNSVRNNGAGLIEPDPGDRPGDTRAGMEDESALF